jgi:hypothetical protein
LPAKLFEVRDTSGKGLFAREFVPKGTRMFFECQQCIGISKGEGATYDYRVFNEGTDLGFNCLCGQDNCFRIVRCVHPVPSELKEFCEVRINSALKIKNIASQPLGKLMKLKKEKRENV